jgi:chorismate mutase
MSEHDSDLTVRRLREEIADLDRAIVDAVNSRLELVARLKEYKESRGMRFVDPERERQLLDDLVSANRGPLSEDGLREFVGTLLDLVKRELARDGNSRSEGESRDR